MVYQMSHRLLGSSGEPLIGGVSNESSAVGVVR